MIPVGLTMVQEPPQPWQDRLYILHKGLGPLVLLVVLTRLGWRAFPPAPPLPPSVSRPQQFAAGIVHAALYTALVVMGVSGYVFVDAGDFPTEALRALGVPPFIPKNEPLSKAAQSVHVTCAFVLIALDRDARRRRRLPRPGEARRRGVADVAAACRARARGRRP